MGYDIGSIDIVASEGFAITKPQLEALRARYSCQPETSILSVEWPDRCCKEHRGMLFVDRIWWSGEGSGNSFEALQECLEHFLGSADLILTWAGGDSHSGLRVLNGQVTRYKVKLALSEPEQG